MSFKIEHMLSYDPIPVQEAPKRKTLTLTPAVMGTAMLLGGLGLAPAAVESADAARVKEGKEIVFSRKLGNCLACHIMDDAVSPGDIGPPLIAMKARFPERSELRAQVYDASANNPDTRMPPFGRHRILTIEQIDKVVDYLYTL